MLVHHAQGVSRGHHGQRRLSQRRGGPVQHHPQPGRSRVDVTCHPLQAGLSLLGLAPQDQVVVPALQGHDRGGDRDPGLIEAAQGLLDLGERHQQGGCVPSAQPRLLQGGSPLFGDGQRSRRVSLVQRGQRLVPQAQRVRLRSATESARRGSRHLTVLTRRSQRPLRPGSGSAARPGPRPGSGSAARPGPPAGIPADRAVRAWLPRFPGWRLTVPAAKSRSGEGSPSGCRSGMTGRGKPAGSRDGRQSAGGQRPCPLADI